MLESVVSRGVSVSLTGEMNTAACAERPASTIWKQKAKGRGIA